MILWLVEPSNFIGAGERHIAEILEKVNAPVLLIINKTDTVEKDKILEFIDTYRKLFQFAEIIPCSALRHQNTDDIIPSIFKYLPYGPQFYDEDTITDQPMRQIVAEIIREKALYALNEEIPHGIAVVIDQMKDARTEKSLILMRPSSASAIPTRASSSENRARCSRRSEATRGMSWSRCWSRKST